MPLYFMPTITNARGVTVPKYASTFLQGGLAPGSSFSHSHFGMMDFRGEGHCLVHSDCDSAADAAVSANADVQRLPDNLDENLTAGQVTAVGNHLESFHIPADWVTTALTWRTVLRRIAGLYQFIQRYKGLGGPGPIFGGAVTLSTTFASLPLTARNALVGTANSFGYDTSALSGASTVRAILKTMALQWGAAPILINGISL